MSALTILPGTGLQEFANAIHGTFVPAGLIPANNLPDNFLLQGALSVVPASDGSIDHLQFDMSITGFSAVRVSTLGDAPSYVNLSGLSATEQTAVVNQFSLSSAPTFVPFTFTFMSTDPTYSPLSTQVTLDYQLELENFDGTFLTLSGAQVPTTIASINLTDSNIPADIYALATAMSPAVDDAILNTPDLLRFGVDASLNGTILTLTLGGTSGDFMDFNDGGSLPYLTIAVWHGLSNLPGLPAAPLDAIAAAVGAGPLTVVFSGHGVNETREIDGFQTWAGYTPSFGGSGHIFLGSHAAFGGASPLTMGAATPAAPGAATAGGDPYVRPLLK